MNIVPPRCTASTPITPFAPVTRRTVVRTAAWSVPVVSVVGISPAFAGSPGEIEIGSATPTSPGTPAVTLQRCTSVGNSAISFHISINNVDAPVGTVVQVTLPEGLEFVSTGDPRNADVAVIAGGVVPVPPFRAVGTAGTYTVMAAYGGKSATEIVQVTAAPGQVQAIRRSITNRNTPAVFSTLAITGLTDGTVGAVMGDQNTSGTATPGNAANSAVLTSDGRVMLWGRDVGRTTAQAAPLTFGSTTLTGMQFVDVWSSINAGNNTTGGVVAGPGPINGSAGAASNTTLYQWYANGSSSITVRRIVGPTGAGTTTTNNRPRGTVLQVASDQGHSFVRTDQGIWRWANATTGNGTLTDVARVVSTATDAFDAWSHQGGTTLVGGFAAVSGRTVTRQRSSGATWSNVTTPTLPTTFVGPARKMYDSDSGTAVLDSGGNLFVLGPSDNATSWHLRATGVVDFSMWGFNDVYIGGLYITTDGRAHRFFGDAGNNWWPVETMQIGERTSGNFLENVTKVFAADGTYLLLTSDGRVWASGGNTDNNGRTGASQIISGAGFVADLDVWGLHLGNLYHGGGYAILQDAACPI